MKDSEVTLTPQKIGLVEVFGVEKPTASSDYFHQFKASKRRVLLDLLVQTTNQNKPKQTVSTKREEPASRGYSIAQNQRRPINPLVTRDRKKGVWPQSGS